ncbi:hypothetical protein T492DRAFT_1135127, partial [Pavlovales sp. CCMP2436]
YLRAFLAHLGLPSAVPLRLPCVLGTRRRPARCAARTRSVTSLSLGTARACAEPSSFGTACAYWQSSERHGGQMSLIGWWLIWPMWHQKSFPHHCHMTMLSSSSVVMGPYSLMSPGVKLDGERVILSSITSCGPGCCQMAELSDGSHQDIWVNFDAGEVGVSEES